LTLLDTSPAPPPSYQRLAIVALVVGVLLLVASVVAGVAFLLVPIFQTELVLATNTMLLSVAAIAFSYGGLLALIGWGLQKERVQASFYLPSPLIFLAAFFTVLVVGQTILTLDIAPAYLFPPFHVLGSLFVPLTVLAFATRRLPRVSLGSIFAQFTWGGLVTIALALVFELIIVGGLALIAFLLGAVLLGADRALELATQLQEAATEPERIFALLAQEPVAMLLAACLAVVMFVILVPLLEELLKATGSAILLARRARTQAPPTKAEAVLWGLAAGAGYAFTENMFNAQNGLTSSGTIVSFWAAAMLLRSGTSLMHIVATTTVVVGWYQALVNKKTRRFFLLLGAAVAAHAVWNSVAVMLGGVSALDSISENFELVSALLVGVVLIFLALLFVVFLFWLFRLIQWAQPPPVEILPHNLTGLTSQQVKEV
jgi:hypothetical protein